MLAVALAALPGRVDAQVADDTIRVGAPRVPSSLRNAETDTSRVSMKRGADSVPMSAYVESITPTPDGFLIVGRNISAAGVTMSIDTIAVSKTFAPLWHADSAASGRARVVYARGRVTGTRVDSTGKTTTIDIPVAAGAFDYSYARLVIGWLPLRVGFRGVLATHDITRGAVHMPFRVVGDERIVARGVAADAWKVELDRPGAPTQTTWLSKATGKTLRVVIVTPGGTIYVE
ncbi:MAG: hypothetical protein V4617_06155 [Gemmatimonadota bacterium]